MTGSAKQSSLIFRKELLDCFVAIAPHNDNVDSRAYYLYFVGGLTATLSFLEVNLHDRRFHKSLRISKKLPHRPVVVGLLEGRQL
jgi:hypothetical protein